MFLEPVNLVQIALAAVAALGFALTVHSARLRALSGLMAMACLWMVFNYLEETAGFREVHLVTPAFRLAYPPLFFLLARGLVYSGPSLSWRDGWHFLPFVIALPLTAYIDWVEWGARTLFLVYSLATARLIWRYQRMIRSTRSDADLISARWMYAILGLYMFDELVDIARMDMAFLHADLPWLASSDAYLASLSFSLLLTGAIIYLAIRHRGLFDGFIPGSLEAVSDAPEPNLEDAGAVSERFEQIDRQVRSEALYTEPRLTVTEVASAVRLAERDVSAAIRMETGLNFNGYINRLRVRDVVALIEQERGQPTGLTLLDMAYTAGFSSKSVFNSYFKRETGETPSAYRDRVSAQD